MSFRNHASINVPVTAVGALAYGLALLLSPASEFRGAGFRATFELMPQRAWGAAFIIGAVIAFFIHRMWAISLLVVTITTWAMLLFTAAFITNRPGVPPTAVIWPGTVAAALLISVAKRGFRAPPR